MDFWVVSNYQDFSERIRGALKQLNFNCSETHVITFAAAVRELPTLENGNCIVIVGAPVITENDVESIRRIRTASQVQVVVVSSTSDSSSTLNAIRAGVADYLDIDGELIGEISKSVSRIKGSGSSPQLKSQLISVVPCHVSSDASILATNLAAVIAKRYRTCCLLDFQLRGGDLAFLLKLQPQHCIYDLVSQAQAIDDVMFQHALAHHESGIQLLAGPKLFSDLRNIDPDTCKSVLRCAQDRFSHVIVATEDIQHSEQIFALASSEHIVVTMRPDLLSLQRAKQHIDFILAQGITSDHLQVVVVGAGVLGELSMSSIRKVLSRISVHSIPDDSPAITLSINVGNPVVLESPRSHASRGIVKLTDVLTGQDPNTTAKKAESISPAKAAALLAFNALPFCK